MTVSKLLLASFDVIPKTKLTLDKDNAWIDHSCSNMNRCPLEIIGNSEQIKNTDKNAGLGVRVWHQIINYLIG